MTDRESVNEILKIFFLWKKIEPIEKRTDVWDVSQDPPFRSLLHRMSSGRVPSPSWTRRAVVPVDSPPLQQRGGGLAENVRLAEEKDRVREHDSSARGAAWNTSRTELKGRSAAQTQKYDAFASPLGGSASPLAQTAVGHAPRSRSPIAAGSNGELYSPSRQVMREDSFYYTLEGVEYGPYARERLQKWVEAGHFDERGPCTVRSVLTGLLYNLTDILVTFDALFEDSLEHRQSQSAKYGNDESAARSPSGYTSSSPSAMGTAPSSVGGATTVSGGAAAPTTGYGWGSSTPLTALAALSHVYPPPGLEPGRAELAQFVATLNERSVMLSELGGGVAAFRELASVLESNSAAQSVRGISGTEFTQRLRTYTTTCVPQHTLSDTTTNAIFRAIDVDQNGLLSLAELKCGLASLFPLAANEAASAMFDACDAPTSGGRGDGLLQPAEFAIAFRSIFALTSLLRGNELYLPCFHEVGAGEVALSHAKSMCKTIEKQYRSTLAGVTKPQFTAWFVDAIRGGDGSSLAVAPRASPQSSSHLSAMTSDVRSSALVSTSLSPLVPFNVQDFRERRVLASSQDPPLSAGALLEQRQQNASAICSAVQAKDDAKSMFLPTLAAEQVNTEAARGALSSIKTMNKAFESNEKSRAVDDAMRQEQRVSLQDRMDALPFSYSGAMRDALTTVKGMNRSLPLRKEEHEEIPNALLERAREWQIAGAKGNHQEQITILQKSPTTAQHSPSDGRLSPLVTTRHPTREMIARSLSPIIGVELLDTPHLAKLARDIAEMPTPALVPLQSSTIEASKTLNSPSAKASAAWKPELPTLVYLDVESFESLALNPKRDGGIESPKAVRERPGLVIEAPVWDGGNAALEAVRARAREAVGSLSATTLEDAASLALPGNVRVNRHGSIVIGPQDLETSLLTAVTTPLPCRPATSVGDFFRDEDESSASVVGSASTVESMMEMAVALPDGSPAQMAALQKVQVAMSQSAMAPAGAAAAMLELAVTLPVGAPERVEMMQNAMKQIQVEAADAVEKKTLAEAGFDVLEDGPIAAADTSVEAGAAIPPPPGALNHVPRSEEETAASRDAKADAQPKKKLTRRPSSALFAVKKRGTRRLSITHDILHDHSIEGSLMKKGALGFQKRWFTTSSHYLLYKNKKASKDFAGGLDLAGDDTSIALSANGKTLTVSGLDADEHDAKKGGRHIRVLVLRAAKGKGNTPIADWAATLSRAAGALFREKGKLAEAGLDVLEDGPTEFESEFAAGEGEGAEEGDGDGGDGGAEGGGDDTPQSNSLGDGPMPTPVNALLTTTVDPETTGMDAKTAASLDAKADAQPAKTLTRRPSSAIFTVKKRGTRRLSVTHDILHDHIIEGPLMKKGALGFQARWFTTSSHYLLYKNKQVSKDFAGGLDLAGDDTSIELSANGQTLTVRGLDADEHDAKKGSRHIRVLVLRAARGKGNTPLSEWEATLRRATVALCREKKTLVEAGFDVLEEGPRVFEEEEDVLRDKIHSSTAEVEVGSAEALEMGGGSKQKVPKPPAGEPDNDVWRETIHGKVNGDAEGGGEVVAAGETAKKEKESSAAATADAVAGVVDVGDDAATDGGVAAADAADATVKKVVVEVAEKGVEVAVEKKEKAEADAAASDAADATPSTPTMLTRKPSSLFLRKQRSPLRDDHVHPEPKHAYEIEGPLMKKGAVGYQSRYFLTSSHYLLCVCFSCELNGPL